jgi:hypothetical protein
LRCQSGLPPRQRSFSRSYTLPKWRPIT